MSTSTNEHLLMLEKTFKTLEIPSSTGGSIEYIHPNWIPENFFDLLKDHLTPNDLKKTSLYGDRFLGQFLLGYHSKRMASNWNGTRRRLKELQEKNCIEGKSIDMYKRYRSLFYKVKISEVIDLYFLDILNPDFIFSKKFNSELIGSIEFRYIFQADFVNTNLEYRRLVFQKYFLKVFLNWISLNP